MEDFLQENGGYFIYGVIATMLLLIVVMLCIPKKNITTREIALASVAVASSFALSYIKVSFVSSGGSITLASIVPLVVFCYMAKPWKGMLAAVAYSILQLIQSAWIISFPQVALDYILPFAVFGVVGFAKPLNKWLKGYELPAAVFVCFAFRFFCHFLSGALPSPTGWGTGVIGSLIYQSTYVPADMIIAVAVLVAFVKGNVINRIEPLLAATSPSENATANETEV